MTGRSTNCLTVFVDLSLTDQIGLVTNQNAGCTTGNFSSETPAEQTKRQQGTVERRPVGHTVDDAVTVSHSRQRRRLLGLVRRVLLRRGLQFMNIKHYDKLSSKF
jgi:hypothetical protein